MALVVVSGAIANKLNQGGEAWVRLSYVLGLRRLGFDVYFLEQISHSACVDALGGPAAFKSSANKAYFDDVMDSFALADRATLTPIDDNGCALVDDDVMELAASAEALINVSGHLSAEPLFHQFRKRVFVDIDPGYTQFWHAAGNSGARLAGHDWFFTIGENIGSPGCSIPDCGIRWHTTRPPVVLRDWPVSSAPDPIRFTTVANWRGSYGSVEFSGRTFGLKVHEFRKLLPLPTMVPAVFEIALNIHPNDGNDLMRLQTNGWQIADSTLSASSPERFRRYVQESAAEISVAQGIYVETSSGWFSDRTTRYLASGKPALVQDTGFSRNLPVGEGLIAFRSLEEAVDGAKRIARDYRRHSHAARRLAEGYFDSDKVLARLMEKIGVAA
jgi:hypothetical protein